MRGLICATIGFCFLLCTGCGTIVIGRAGHSSDETTKIHSFPSGKTVTVSKSSGQKTVRVKKTNGDEVVVTEDSVFINGQRVEPVDESD